MPLWEDWLIDVSGAWGLTVAETGIIVSLCFTIGVLVVILIATRGKQALSTITISSFLCIVLFIFLGWFPVWLGSIIALVLAVFMASVFMKISGVK